MEIQYQPTEPFSKRIIGKILLDTLLVFGSGIVQTSFFPAVNLFPASPDLMLSAVVGLAVFEGERTGALAGIGAGVVAVSLGGAGTAPLPLFYMLSGYFMGIAAKVNFVRNILSWFLYITFAALARAGLSFLYSVFTVPDVNVMVTLISVVMPEFAMTVAFSVFNYFLARLCVLPFKRSAELT